MRVPDIHTVQRVSFMMVSFIFGIICGALIFLIMYGHSMDDLIYENRELQSKVIELDNQLESSISEREKLSQQSQQKLVIKQIEIEILHKEGESPDRFLESEVRQLLREDIKFLISMPIESVAETSETLVHLVNGRSYEINKQKVGLKLETLVLYSRALFRVYVVKG